MRDHCLSHGFAPVMTVANGDCGIDAMLIMGGSSRGIAERQRLRTRLSDFMKAKAVESAWQRAFLVCQEHDPVVPCALVCTSQSRADDQAAAGAGADPPPLPPPAAPPANEESCRLRAAVS